MNRCDHHRRKRRGKPGEQVEALKAVAGERLSVAIDLAVSTGQRRGDLLSLKCDQLTDQGIVSKQSKTGAGVLIEWSEDLRAIVDRAKALVPQVPGEYLLRQRSGIENRSHQLQAPEINPPSNLRTARVR